jgi:hypothetical protein
LVRPVNQFRRAFTDNLKMPVNTRSRYSTEIEHRFLC